jgi:hypothetical protein
VSFGMTVATDEPPGRFWSEDTSEETRDGLEPLQWGQ